MIIFSVRQGLLLSPSGLTIAKGVFSGHGIGLNNPDMEKVVGVGPIPRGIHVIGALEAQHGKLGPNVMSLTPAPGTNDWGRSGFFMHGDYSGDVQRDASDGCIIAALNIRLLVNGFPDRRINII
jgi:hypothetical protein